LIYTPSKATLKKYGLTLADWQEIYSLQTGICPICKRPLLKPVVDHLHIRNWKKMKPEKRKQYVRGIPCNYCNRRRLSRGMTLEIARNIVEYLERFEKRLKENK
jgi:PHP family Zn ribbon phosphoesterase